MAKIRKHELLLVAIGQALKLGYTNITRDGIAFEAGVAMGTITNYLGTMKQIKREVVRHGIRTENLTIVAQALINKDPLTSSIPRGLRHRAISSI